MQDEFETHLTIDGFVVQDGRRVPTTLALGALGVEAASESGPAGRILWRGASFRRDQADDALLVVSRDATLGSTDPGFLRAIEGAAGNDVDRELAKLQGLPTGWKGSGVLGCLAFFLLAGWLVTSVPGCYRGAIDKTVRQLPPSVDRTLGEQGQESLDFGPEFEDETVTAAIETMVERLAPHFEGTELDAEEVEWTITVIENDEINAFALPGGFITVFTGLIDAADDPDTVAGILGHEMVHVLQRHGLKNVANQIGIFAGFGLIFGDAGGLIGLAGTLSSAVASSGYGRSLESEADRMGVIATTRAGLDPDALGAFFEMLKREHGDIPLAARLFASHPDHSTRMEALRAIVDELDVPEPRPLDLDWADVQRRVRGEGEPDKD